jgi:uncharacterized protein involved in tolerance to divalent cations
LSASGATTAEGPTPATAPPGLVEVHVTAPDRDTADRLARLLVDERLAGCVQVLPGVTSTYRWEGAVETADEVLLLAKTTTAALAALVARVEREHPYDVPEVLAVPVVTASEPYAAWLRASTTRASHRGESPPPAQDVGEVAEDDTS